MISQIFSSRIQKPFLSHTKLKYTLKISLKPYCKKTSENLGFEKWKNHAIVAYRNTIDLNVSLWKGAVQLFKNRKEALRLDSLRNSGHNLNRRQYNFIMVYKQDIKVLFDDEILLIIFSDYFISYFRPNSTRLSHTIVIIFEICSKWNPKYY